MHKCLPRDAIDTAFAVVRCPSVRLFVTLYIETANFTIKLFIAWWPHHSTP